MVIDQILHQPNYLLHHLRLQDCIVLQLWSFRLISEKYITDYLLGGWLQGLFGGRRQKQQQQQAYETTTATFNRKDVTRFSGGFKHGFGGHGGGGRWGKGFTWG